MKIRSAYGYIVFKITDDKKFITIDCKGEKGASFEEFQSIPTSGATGWEFFEIGGEHYLAVANYGDGSSYEGEWERGGRHGTGSWSAPSGECYDGEWREDKRSAAAEAVRLAARRRRSRARADKQRYRRLKI